MSLLGTHLTILIGPTVAVPAPILLTENLLSVEVTARDTERSAFQIVFRAGRSGITGLIDYPLALNPLLQPFHRVILIATFGVLPQVLIDGVITDIQLNPGQEPGAGTITVTGEDVSVMMDRDDESAEHPAQPDLAIVAKLILRYARFGLIPTVIPPKVIDPPIPVERIPVQQCTDLQYIERLGRRHGHVFFISPGLVPFTNFAYWGPPKRFGFPQSALSVNMAGQTNVRSIDFRHEALEPAFVEGNVQDHRTNAAIPVRSFASLRLPPLAFLPTWLRHGLNAKTVRFRTSTPSAMSGFGRAQAITDQSNDQVVTATGELDSTRYGGPLRARGLVGLRGAGFLYDGLWYVKEVTHSIREGDYTQRFTLTREGVGSTVPAVLP